MRPSKNITTHSLGTSALNAYILSCGSNRRDRSANSLLWQSNLDSWVILVATVGNTFSISDFLSLSSWYTILNLDFSAKLTHGSSLPIATLLLLIIIPNYNNNNNFISSLRLDYVIISHFHCYHTIYYFIITSVDTRYDFVNRTRPTSEFRSQAHVTYYNNKHVPYEPFTVLFICIVQTSTAAVVFLCIQYFLVRNFE